MCFFFPLFNLNHSPCTSTQMISLFRFYCVRAYFVFVFFFECASHLVVFSLALPFSACQPFTCFVRNRALFLLCDIVSMQYILTIFSVRVVRYIDKSIEFRLIRIDCDWLNENANGTHHRQPKGRQIEQKKTTTQKPKRNISMPEKGQNA